MDINEKMEKLTLNFESSGSKSLDISLDQLKSLLKEFSSDQKQIIEIFLNRILLNNKRNMFLSKLKEKETHIIEKIGSILNTSKVSSLILEKFLTYFQNESMKKIEDNMDIFRRNLFSSFFVDFISEDNIENIIRENFELISYEFLEIQINRMLKVPLIFSNYSQNFCKKLNSESFYKILIKNLQNNENFRKNTKLIVQFLNKVTFNGLLG
jgi:hypothetical protein